MTNLAVIAFRIVGILAFLIGASAMAAAATPIFVYHRFDPVAAAPTTVTVAGLTSQLSWLQQHGYRIIPLHDAMARLNSPLGGNGLNAVVTVDDGHVSVYTVLFPLIKKLRLPVTLFIYPSAISHASYALTWAQLHEMEESGLVDVESHTYWHPNFRIERHRLSPDAFLGLVNSQLVKSKAVLENRLGKEVDQLAWPFGIFDPELEAAAKRAGYAAAFGYAGGSAHAGDDVFALPRIPLSDGDRGCRLETLIATRKTQCQ